jgi:glycosyltransferase involved in cell wall biosynthesis
MPRFSFVIPVFNEAEGLPEFYSRVTAVVATLDGDAELIFVDDGSTDGSGELLLELQRGDPAVRVIRLARNFGHQIAITAGLDRADGDATIIMDADLQDPPELTQKLVARWEEGYDIVYAVRKRRHGEAWSKQITAALYYKLMGRLARVEIPQNVGDYRLVDRRALDVFRSLRERNRYVRGMFSWVGFRQTGVEYERPARYAGEPSYSLAASWRLAIDGLISFSNVPLQLALGFGFVISIFSFVFGVIAVITKVTDALVVPGWTSIVVAVSFVGGVQLMVLGMLGLYVGRIFDEVKARPLYVVGEAHGFDGPAVSESRLANAGRDVDLTS